MPHSDLCGKSTTLPFHSQYCGGNICDEHRLPPKHPGSDIDIIQMISRTRASIWFYQDILDYSLRQKDPEYRPVF